MILRTTEVDPKLWVRFVNTEMLRDGEPFDALGSVAELFDWARQRGIVEGTASERPGLRSPNEAGLEAVRGLRTELRGLADQVEEGHRPDDQTLANLNEALTWSSVSFAIEKISGEAEAKPEGDDLVEYVSIEGPGPNPILSLIALSAVRFLTGGYVRRLKQCASETCILYFVDETKNQSRRWCSMKTCGNRDKVRAHYHRSRSGHTGQT